MGLELWHLIRERESGDDIIIAKWPTIDENLSSDSNHHLTLFSYAEEVIINLRNIRKGNNIANKIKLELFVKKNNELDKSYDSVIIKMGNLSLLEYTNDMVENANSFIVDGNEYFVPFGDSINVDEAKSKLTEDIEYTTGFLKSVQQKLQNENFVSGAPENVVAIERKKEADALNKIAILKEKLSTLT